MLRPGNSAAHLGLLAVLRRAEPVNDFETLDFSI
jgi:hypothetical protein